MNIRKLPALFAVFLVFLCSAKAEDYDLEFDASETGTLTFEVAESSLVHVTVDEQPNGFSPAFLIKTGDAGHQGSGRFRVSPGPHTITARHAYSNPLTGKVRIKVHVIANPDPTEPVNDSPETATPVKPGDTLSLQMFPNGDRDFFQMEVPGPGYLQFSATKPVKGIALDISGTDPNGNNMGKGIMRTDSGGVILLQIKDSYSTGSSLETIELTTNFVPEIDHDEPNNRAEDALELGIEEWREILLAPYGDRDHFLVHVGKPGILKVETILPDDFFDVKFELLNTDGTATVAQGYQLVVKEAGSYILRVSSTYSSQASPEPFSFRVNWKNDLKITPRSATEATTIEPGRRYGTKSAGKGDLDRMKVEVDQLSIVSFHAEYPAGVDLTFKHNNREGNPIWVRTSSSVEVSLYPRYGRYSPDTIWVEANVEPEIDPAEPNDTKEEAKMLTPGVFQEFYVYPVRDREWFKVDIEKAGDYKLSLVDQNMQVTDFGGEGSIGVYSDAEEVLLEQGYAWRDSSIPLEKGTYLIHFKDHWDNSAFTTPLYIAIHKSGSPPSSPEVEKPKNEAGVYVVGVELGDGGQSLKTLVESSGGAFSNADEASQIGEKLEAIVSTATEPLSGEKEKKKRNWWWLLIPVTLAGAWYARKKSRKSQGS